MTAFSVKIERMRQILSMYRMVKTVDRVACYISEKDPLPILKLGREIQRFQTHAILGEFLAHNKYYT